MSVDRKKLLELFDSLGAEQQETLLAFAEFLLSRAPQPAAGAGVPVAPEPIERPAEETVVMAIRRLTRTYPMLDRRKLFDATSRFMAQHALQGRAAPEVIDELEIVFAEHYRRLKGND
jgi:hypothetical protein